MKKIVAFMAVLVALNLSLGLGFSSYSMAVDKVYGVTATVGGLVQKVFTELTFGEAPSTNTFSLKDPQNESLLSEYTVKLPDRVRLCLQKQGKKKTAQQDAKR